MDPLCKGTNQAMKPVTETASTCTHAREVLILFARGPHEATKTRRKLAKNEDLKLKKKEL
jgi:hypothetical protein